MTEVIRKTLNTIISPMVYIMMAVSVIWGVAFTFFRDLDDVQNSLLFKYGTIIDYRLWGVALMVGGILCLTGFAISHDEVIRIGAFIGFITWLFACITYLQHGFYFALFVTGLFHLLFQGYVFLATSLGYLRRQHLDSPYRP